MRHWLALLFALALPAQADQIIGSATPLVICAPIGTLQTFDSSPLGSTWAAYNTSAPDCPLQWSASNGGTMERTRPAAGANCDNTNAGIRLNSDTHGVAGCSRFQLVALDDGLLSAGGWDAPGASFWMQNDTQPALNWMGVMCDNAASCASLLFYNQATGNSVSCGTFGSFAVGDYMGVCWDAPSGAPGPGQDPVHIRAWNNPPSTGLPTTWGAPDCTFTTCPTGGCDTVGKRAGISMRSASPNFNAVVRYDNFTLFTGCRGSGIQNVWEAGNTWEADNSWV